MRLIEIADSNAFGDADCWIVWRKRVAELIEKLKGIPA